MRDLFCPPLSTYSNFLRAHCKQAFGKWPFSNDLVDAEIQLIPVKLLFVSFFVNSTKEIVKNTVLDLSQVCHRSLLSCLTNKQKNIPGNE